MPMRAVRGTVVSSKPISLSKAAATLSDFAQSAVCSRPEISAYLHRASFAFDEVVRLHREIKAACEPDWCGTPQEDGGSRSRKKRKRGEGEGGDQEEIRGADGAKSVEKNRILASGAKLVENGGVPWLEAEVGDQKTLASTVLSGEKLVEDHNAIRSYGSDEKRKKKKEKIGEIDGTNRIDFQMDDKKNVEVLKGHDKEEKKKDKDNEEINRVTKSSFDKKKGVESSRAHGGAVQKKEMEEEESKDKKRKREGIDEDRSNLNEKENKTKERTCKNGIGAHNKEKDSSNKWKSNMDKHEERGSDDTSDHHKKKRRMK